MTSRQDRRFHERLNSRSQRALFALMLLLFFGGRSFAQEKYELTVEPSFGRVYPPGRWIPLRIRLGNNTDAAVEGSVVIPVLKTKTATEFHVPVAVPAHAQVSIDAYGYLPEKDVSKEVGAHSVPVATAEWRSDGGERLTRSQILAQPDTAGNSQPSASGLSGYLFLVASDRDEAKSGDSFSAKGLENILSGQVSYPVDIGECDRASLPREPAGYGAVRAVILDLSPDSLDACQRKALMDYLLAGGNLLLAAPLGDADPTGTWLDPYLPVHLLGQRMADRVVAASSIQNHPTSQPAESPLKFREFIDICEATDAGGEVLLRDANYVHAAYKRIGLGRVIFTSFPVNALEPSDSRAAILWSKLLDLKGPANDWSDSELARQRDGILESMIGMPAAPWSRAALVVGGYVLLCLCAQLGFWGARRSQGFGAMLLLAIGLSVCLFAMAATRNKGRNDIAMARLATIELGAQGGGIRQDAVVFYGREDPSLSLRTPENAQLRPVVDSTDNPPVVEQLPFAAINAGVRAARIERIWQASQAVGEERALSGMLQFTPQGCRVDFDNRVGQTVLAPLLLAGDTGSYRLADIPSGKSSLILGPRNPSGDFTNVALLTGEDAGLRARIIEAACAPRKDSADTGRRGEPQVGGWLDPTVPGLASLIVRCEPEPTSKSEKVLLRAPLAIVPSAPGSVVRIPADFVELTGTAMHGTLFDPATHEWIPSTLESSWQLGIQVPPGVGRCKLMRAFLTADLSAPKHSITLRREQCQHGELQDNPDGAICASWSRVTGIRHASIELGAGDVDQNNCLWLRLSVERAASDAAAISPQWKFNSLSVELEVQAEENR